MSSLWKGAAGLAGALHALFFVMESVLFTRPDVYGRFLVTAEQAATLRLAMLNQGFYNLFLAAGCLGGLAQLGRRPVVGQTLVVYTCLYMVGAGVVLLASEPRLAGAALVQAGPPLAALVGWWLARGRRGERSG